MFTFIFIEQINITSRQACVSLSAWWHAVGFRWSHFKMSEGRGKVRAEVRALLCRHFRVRGPGVVAVRGHRPVEAGPHHQQPRQAVRLHQHPRPDLESRSLDGSTGTLLWRPWELRLLDDIIPRRRQSAVESKQLNFNFSFFQSKVYFQVKSKRWKPIQHHNNANKLSARAN